MNIELKHQPSFALAVVTLAANEEVKVEPGAMVSFSDGITVETKSEGGFFGGLKRMVGGESFFQNTYRASGQGGELTLAPDLPGDMIVIPVQGDAFLLQSGAYIASEMGLTFDTQWGAVEERVLRPGQKYTVDTGHIIGFDSSISFEVRRAGNWKSTILGGEGLVCELTGPGRVLMQTRSEEAFLGWLIPKLPKSSGNN